MNEPFPEDIFYGENHEWARVEGELVRVGVSDFAQAELGEIVYVELPKPGARIKRSEPFAELESNKSLSDVFAPIDGEVEAVNALLEDDPAKVNDAPYGEGWLIVVRPDNLRQIEELMTAEGYRKLLDGR